MFSVVRNEMYFLPHYLRHYRALGVREFWFLDDHSSDGTRELLMADPDCGVLQSDFKFGDMYQGKRFGIQARTLIPRKLLTNRWVLIADADEFLLLPSPFKTIDELAMALDADHAQAARAIMLDFFPSTLSELEQSSTDASPFSICPNFDPFERLTWPDQAPNPTEISLEDGVRPRLLAKLLESSDEMKALMPSYRFANANKIPLIRWTEQTQLLTAHHANVETSNKVQLVFAHFKFYPALRERIEDALRTSAYWNDSIEYRFLDMAYRALDTWPLAGTRTRRFSSTADMEATGLLFARLP